MKSETKYPAWKIGRYLGLKRSQIKRVLDRQTKLAGQGIRKRLGELLLEAGLIEPQDLERALGRQRLRRIRTAPVFSIIDRSMQGILCDLIDEVTVPAGEEFIRQDTVGDCFYMIVSGKALVFRRDELGEEVPLEILTAGEMIGEMGYFSDGKRSASVRTQEDTLLSRIFYRDLHKAFDLVPQLAVNFLHVVTERLRRANLRFQDTVKETRFAEISLKSLYDFLDISEIINLRMGIGDLIERVVLMAGRIMNADRATLFLVDRAAEQLWSMVAEGESNREIRIPMDTGIAGWVAQHDGIVNVKDAYEDDRFNQEVDRKTGYRTRSILCGPVINLQGELIGVIQVINKKDGFFDKKDETSFRVFTHQIAISLENFYLSQKIMANYDKMSILLDVATSISQTLDLSTMITRIVEKITQILDAERSSLFLLDRRTGELWSRVAQGVDFSEIRFPCHEGLAGHVVSTGEVLNIRNAYEDPRFNPRVDHETGFKTRTVLCMPMLSRGEIIGVTEVMNKREGVFEREDEDLLRAMTSQIAVALENAQLFERMMSMKNYLESVHESISNVILTLDNDYRIVTANRAALLLFQRGSEALHGHDIREVIGSGNDSILRHIERVYTSHVAVIDHDIELTLGENAPHSVNLNFAPLIGHKRDYQGLVLVFEDISQEKRLKGTLTRYMARDIVEKVLNDPERQGLGGIRNKATILFTDIRGFTAMAEKISAEQTVDLLNDCFSVLVDILFEHEGVLDKYIGDSIMAVFGVPYVHHDDASRAVHAALEMRQAMIRFNARRIEAGLEPIRLGIGIATGEVVSGNIGCEKRMDFTVIGDDVNISQYLEKQNKQYGTGILISESTKMDIGDAFVTRLVDRILFKGKKIPVNVYEVLGEKGCHVPREILMFYEAMALYHKRQFREAGLLFAQGAQSDPPCRLYEQRCRYFLDNPPPPEWGGLWIALEK
ncbi:MAG: GAF domain-containing protein [Syntrophales bacterium]|nr:GAF domain-containing protein [Syntrophales bacterium]